MDRNPLDDLPKSSFNFEDWKKAYSLVALGVHWSGSMRSKRVVLFSDPTQ